MILPHKTIKHISNSKGWLRGLNVVLRTFSFGQKEQNRKKNYSFSNAIAERGVLSHIEPFVHSVDDCVQAWLLPFVHFDCWIHYLLMTHNQISIAKRGVEKVKLKQNKKIEAFSWCLEITLLVLQKSIQLNL